MTVGFQKKIITLLISLLMTSTGFSATTRTMSQDAKEAAKYFEKLERVARNKNYTIAIEENTYLFKNVEKQLKKDNIFCFEVKKNNHAGSGIFKTYLTVISMEVGIQSPVPSSTIKSFFELFKSGPFSKKTLICDNPMSDGRQVIFISGDRKYSLDLILYI